MLQFLTQKLTGSWYTKHERAKRTTLFYCTASLAHMFSGYLQAAAYDNLDGHLGHAGWQWYVALAIPREEAHSSPSMQALHYLRHHQSARRSDGILLQP